MKIGFIGQGFVGKSYADDFEYRGFNPTRYSLEEPYVKNKDAITECDIVFIAVPTPTTPNGFDYSIVKNALTLIGKGKTAVIKSTILPGTTNALQKEFPDIFVLFSPEFLSQVTAKEEAAHPIMNIVGIPEDTPEFQRRAKEVQRSLPAAPFARTMQAVEAECIKYGHNLSGYFQIIWFNILYDLSQKFGASWEPILQAIEADPLISNRYANPIHKSGRGAGGACFIKDFAAFRGLYEKMMSDQEGITVLKALESKNLSLLRSTNKDGLLVEGVYGKQS